MLIELQSEKYLDSFPMGEQARIKGVMDHFKVESWREVLLRVTDKIIVGPKFLELQIRRSGVLALIHQTAYGEERVFPDGGIEVLSHSIEWTKIRDGAAAIREEATACGENQLKKILRIVFGTIKGCWRGSMPR